MDAKARTVESYVNGAPTCSTCSRLTTLDPVIGRDERELDNRSPPSAVRHSTANQSEKTAQHH